MAKNVPEPQGSDAKEVFAFFGRAAYYAQVLEQELMIFAVMMHLSGQTSITQMAVEALFETFESRTFGQLLREARALTAISSNLEAKLMDALNRRNDLAHRFFARRSEDFISNAGRVEMIEELHQAAVLFEEVNAALTAIREPLSQKLGLSQDLVERELDRMVARAAARDGGVL